MALFKTIQEIQQYIKVNVTSNVGSIIPFVKTAQEKYLRKYLGEDLLKKLDDYFNAENETTDEKLDALLPYVQSPLTKFAYYLAIPNFDVQINEGGFAVVSNGNLAPASKDRVQALRDSMLQLAYEDIETLLRFLEKNKADYDDWTSSDAYTIATNLLINSGEEFDKFVNIEQSRLKYQELRQTIENIEILQIEPIISKELSDEIKEEVKDDDISEENEKILTLLKRSVANLTWCDYLGDKPEATRFKRLGEHYLSEVKKILDNNIADYPLYEASDSYDSEKTSYQQFENKEENKNFVFGG